MRAGFLFSGIGAFELAFQRAGFELAWGVEQDERCRRVLAARFPGVRLHDDVRDVHTPGVHSGGPCRYDLPAIDVLVGGWPCQPFSVAGSRRGTDDDRDLWPEFARLIGELRPRWVVGENVPGLLSIDEGRVWSRTITDLSDLGYGVCWRVLDAQHFGVPQRRRRVFLVGHLGDLTGPAQVLFDTDGSGRDSASRGEAGTDVAGPLGGGAYGTGRQDEDDPNLVMTTLGTRSGGQHLESPYVTATLNSGGNDGGFRTEPGEHEVLARPLLSHGVRQDPTRETFITSVAENQRGEIVETDYSHQLTSGGGKPGQGYPAVRDGMTVRRLTPTECERLQGFPDRWTDVEGTSDSARYRQLGNAVCVPTASWIAYRLKAAEEGTSLGRSSREWLQTVSDFRRATDGHA